ncbi:Ca-activated chloride channel family protein [Singulisphaera sp. GP187]|uniref:VIT domain-containing protein n=1 Tax=Singulisphaera sp. GP187 TaxID=1882752 RepID=UPI000927989F|nr:VIT domain-containing protein [Singulisphaera sp. GP187]SIO58327.1 Ca-activated chloride channel family protein [Singulisphaera sp. GP187]
MNDLLPLLSDDETRRGTPDGDEAGLGALQSDRGLLPLKAMEVRGRIDGLLAQVSVRQTFVNVLDEPLEATYLFPLPDRAAVTRFRMEVAGRVIEGVLEERGQARKEYQQAIKAGHRASIAEEERPGVFTLRVGNLPPGEEAVIDLSLTGPLPFADGEVTFRFPLVVAPRYIPGIPLPGPSTGQGVAHDTDAVPDASRISPPVLLPGFPNPVQLALTVDVHESIASVGELRSSLHAVNEAGDQGYRRVTLLTTDERLNRDFILRFKLGAESIDTSLSVHPDSTPNRVDAEGTFVLTIVPPAATPPVAGPRDLIFVLDRSGSMEGWKMVTARRALARMVDTLGAADRFNIYAFDDQIECPPGFPDQGLVPATDRQRFRAVEFLAALSARGGTEMASPLNQAVEVLTHAETGRDRILVLVTDGQVGNEDQILKGLGRRLQGIRIFTLGIDRAVNEGFLHRLAELGGGSCEIVESDDRLDEVMDAMRRRIGTPVLTEVRLEEGKLPLIPDTLVPGRIPDVFAEAPVLILGRYRGAFPESLTVSGRDASGQAWSQAVTARFRDNPAIAAAWARGQLRKLEDRYTVGPTGCAEIEKAIVSTSLKFGVLCRFTAYVAIDRSEVVNPGGQIHQVIQPVESPEGWMEPRSSRGGSASLRAHSLISPSQARNAPPDLMDFDLAKLEIDESDDEPVLMCAMPAAPEYQSPSPLDVGGPRARTLRLLEELETTIQAGGKNLVDALRILVLKLEAVLIEWKTLNGSAPGLPELEELVEKIRRLMKKADQKPATGDPIALSDLATSAAAVGLLLTAEDSGPKSAETERETFWK